MYNKEAQASYKLFEPEDFPWIKEYTKNIKKWIIERRFTTLFKSKQ